MEPIRLNGRANSYTYIGSKIAYFRPQVAPNRPLEAAVGSKASFGSHKWLEVAGATRWCANLYTYIGPIGPFRQLGQLGAEIA